MSDLRSSKSSILYVVLGASVALNVVWLLSRGPSGETDGAADSEVAESASTADSSDSNAGAASDGAAKAAAQPAAEAPAAAGAEWKVMGAKVEHSLARTFQVGAGEAGDALASVFTRLFVWDVDMRRDLQPGDAIAVVWRSAPDGLPEVAAGSLKSSKLGQTVAAYRWQRPGDPFASYWRLDGTEAPFRLKGGPIENYEQITSLLKDRPSHKGMDFKTPVGTEVTSPRDGTVTRVNWNWTYNGNCIEIRFDDGVLAKFLHLSENKVAEGHKVGAGQVIALTGNTGHSTAPHLHYQLDRGDQTVDPLDYHGTIRRSLTADQVAALKRDVAEFEKMLGEATGA